jgi:Fe-S cluster assembly protein SufD
MLKNDFVILKDVFSSEDLLKNFSKGFFHHLETFDQKFSLPKKIKIEKKQIEKAILSKSYLVFVDGYLDTSLSEVSTLNLLKIEENESFKLEKDFSLNLPKKEFLISLEKDVTAKDPLQILQVVTGKNSFLSLNICIDIGKNSCLDIFSTGLNLADKFLFNLSICLSLSENAKANYYSTFFDFSSYFFNQFKAKLERNASLDVSIFMEGGILESGNYKIDLEENSSINFHALSLLKEKRQSSMNIDIDHRAASSSSFCKMKGILTDEAISSFQTNVKIGKDAQKSLSQQICSHYLLSEKAKARARPYLNVFTDDVKASHGATFFNLKDDELFYLKTRGISESHARYLLIKGICQEMINLVKVESLRKILEERALSNFKVEE